MLMAWQAERSTTFLGAEDKTKVPVYVSRPVIYSLWSSDYSEIGLIYQFSGSRHLDHNHDDNISKYPLLFNF